MDKLIAVIKREYLERVRTRSFVIATLLVPVFISGIFLVPAYLASRAAASSAITNVAILDATSSGLGKRVAALLEADTVARLDGAKTPTVRTVAPAQLGDAEQQALAEVMGKTRTGYLVLTDSTLDGKSARYAGRNASSIADIDKLSSTVRQAVTMTRLEQAGVASDRIEQLSHLSVRLSTERVDDKGKGSGEGRTAVLVGFGIAFLLYFSIILHGQNVLRGVLEEKTTRVAEVVLSSVKPDTLLAGKVLGVGAVGLTQQILWLGISAYVMQTVAPLIMRRAPAAAAATGGGASSLLGSGILTPELFATVLVFFLIGFVFYATLFAAVGAMVNSEQEAQQAAQPVMILLVATIVLIQVVMLNPTGGLAQALSWLPFSSPIVMPMRMAMMPVPWYQVAGSIVVGILGCAGAVWLAARIYRVGMLMYGKKPSFAELARWVKYAR